MENTPILHEKTVHFTLICLVGDKGILLSVIPKVFKIFPEMVENSVESVDKSRLIVGFWGAKGLKTIFWEYFLWKNGYK